MAESAPSVLSTRYPRVASLSAPLAGASPAGQDVQYDDDFQALKAEVDAVASAAAEADYERIVELGEHVLRTKSKDLMAVGYLTLGLLRTEGVDGLAAGWALAAALVDRYWEDLHPQKSVRRRNALQFMADRTRGYLQQRQQEAPSVGERLGLEVALSSVQAVQSRAMAELKEQAPALSGVVSALSERLRRTPEPEPETEPEPEPEPAAEPEPERGEDQRAALEARTGTEASAVSEEPSAPPATASTDGSAAGGDGVASQRDDAGAARSAGRATPAATPAPSVDEESVAVEVLAKLCGVLRDRDPADPLPYRLMRACIWSDLRELPSNDGGVMPLWPPDYNSRRDVERWVELEAHEQVVRLAELLLTSDSVDLWFTLQRLEVQAMERLGDAYARAAEAVRLELALLVRRLPALLDLRFKDDTPCADAATVAWIETEVLPILGSDEGGAASDPLKDAYREAQRVLSGGDVAGAVELLQKGGEDASGEARFRRRLYLARLCLRAERPALALSLLEGLDEEVDRHGIDAWTPALALEVWSRLYECYQRIASEARDAERMQGLAAATLAKIARLDASRALTLLK